MANLALVMRYSRFLHDGYNEYLTAADPHNEGWDMLHDIPTMTFDEWLETEQEMMV